MFGRWLALVRRGPDLLPDTSLGMNWKPVDRDECDAPPNPSSPGLSSSDADAYIRRRKPGDRQGASLVSDP